MPNTQFPTWYGRTELPHIFRVAAGARRYIRPQRACFGLQPRERIEFLLPPVAVHLHQAEQNSVLSGRAEAEDTDALTILLLLAC